VEGVADGDEPARRQARIDHAALVGGLARAAPSILAERDRATPSRRLTDAPTPKLVMGGPARVFVPAPGRLDR
jgi:hypothetical protein